MDIAWVDSIHVQCVEQNVPFFFKQWGGRRDKGGCLLNGYEIKEWPVAA
jgi:protein gp37